MDWPFIIIGLVVGTFGTLVGAGGGFILIPILIYFLPSASPAYLTSISLVIIFFNSLSGSLTYWRQNKIDFKWGSILALAAIPGAIAGAASTQFLPRNIFDFIFGVFLSMIGIYLFIKPGRSMTGSSSSESNPIFGIHSRSRLVTGILSSLLVGFISSFLGIGGGIIHVPILIYLLNFETHIATATSHFMLCILALVGALIHFRENVFDADSIKISLWLIPGTVLGAQIGAYLSQYTSGKTILRCLALSLIFVGFKLILL